MRIATKYPRIAERHFEQSGRQAEVIEVKGSVELAPLVGLADGIVDLVDTGRTLDENQLEVREEITVCTARLIANRVAHKLRAAEIDGLAERLREAAADEGSSGSSGTAATPRAAPRRVRGARRRPSRSHPRGRRDHRRGRRPGDARCTSSACASARSRPSASASIPG